MFFVKKEIEGLVRICPLDINVNVCENAYLSEIGKRFVGEIDSFNNILIRITKHVRLYRKLKC